MNSTLALVILNIFFYCSLNGQTTRSIEVVVRDAMEIEGESFIYAVIINEDDLEHGGFQALNQPFLTAGGKSYISLEAFEEIIEQSKIERIDNNKLTIFPKEELQENFIYVRLLSKAQLLDFIEKLKLYNNIFGFVSQIDVGDAVNFENGLYKRILKTARIKAQRIASIENLEIGEIIEISEFIDSESESETFNLNRTIGWTAYPPLSPLGDDVFDIGTTKKINKVLRVKFELK